MIEEFCKDNTIGCSVGAEVLGISRKGSEKQRLSLGHSVNRLGTHTCSIVAGSNIFSVVGIALC